MELITLFVGIITWFICSFETFFVRILLRRIFNWLFDHSSANETFISTMNIFMLSTILKQFCRVLYMQYHDWEVLIYFMTLKEDFNSLLPSYNRNVYHRNCRKMVLLLLTLYLPNVHHDISSYESPYSFWAKISANNNKKIVTSPKYHHNFHLVN